MVGRLAAEYSAVDLRPWGLVGRVVRGRAMGARDYMGLIREAKSHVSYYLQSLVLGMNGCHRCKGVKHLLAE
jgi:phage gpG-like protein